MKARISFLDILSLVIISFCLLGGIFLFRSEIRDFTLSREQSTLPASLSRQETERSVVQTSTKTISLPSSSPTNIGKPESDTVSSSLKTEDTVPAKINLAVPFTSQAPEKNWDQPWQDACEEAAVLMMDAYYKNYKLSPLFARDEILKIVTWEEEQKWDRSIEIEKIQKIFEEFLKVPLEKQIKIVENPSIEQIKKYIAKGTPVYVVADGKILPNPHFQNGGPAYHALILRGYTETEFISNDPGTQFGENFKYKYDDLMNSIRDWNGGEVKTGRRVILVIE